MVKKFKGSGTSRSGGAPGAHKQDFNAHTTGGDLKHNASHILMNPEPAAPFDGATVQDAITTTSNFLNTRSDFVIENETFTGSGTDPALEISGSTALRHYKNCTFTANSGVDAWALVVSSSTGLVFENCTFTGPEGQIIKCINAGVHFVDCEFISGSGTALTNPQAILGYGYTDSSSNRDLKFTNGVLIYGTSSVETSTAPTLAIVELGGNNNIAFAGRVIIDGFYVKSASDGVGVHNYTTFLLHNNKGVTPHLIRNLTIDANDNISTGTGTLSGMNGEGALFEVSAAGSDGYSKTVIDGLNILNVKDPTASHGRNIMYIERCSIRGLSFDGSSESNTGEYQDNLIELDSCDLKDFEIFPNNAVSGTRIFNFQYIVSASDGRIRTWDNGYTNLIDLEDDNTLRGIYIYMNVEQGGSVFLINDKNNTIEGCYIQSSITSATIPLITSSSGGIGLRFINNFVGWDLSGNDTIANFGNTEICVIMNNVFGKGFAFSGAPGVTYGDTGSIGSDSHNIRAPNIGWLLDRGTGWEKL